MIKYIKVVLMTILITVLPSTTAFAQEDGQSVEDEFDSYFEEEEETHDERRIKDYEDLAHYELMDHADESWWDVASQTGNNILVGVRDFAWATYTIVAEVVTTIVYHMFNLDLVQMLLPNLQSFASSFAGQIINNLLIVGMAFVALTVIVRGLLQQDWGAFFKILLLTIASLALLFSIQSERFNYIGLVDSVSTDIENTIIATPPSLMTGEEVNYGTTDTAINMENRVYNALLLQPYLDLTYGDTSVERINEDRDDGFQVYDYLDADPLDEEGVETRGDIAQHEFEVMENNNVNSANAAGQIGKIIMFGLSLLVQGFIFIVFAAVRYMLQMLLILALVLLPLVLLLSLFTSFEKMLLGYIRKVGQLILYKALLVFFMIFAMSIMQVTYSIQNYGMIQAIVFQLVIGISVIMIYFYRNSALETVSDSGGVNPSVATSTGGAGQSLKNAGHKVQSKANAAQNKNKEVKESDSRNSAGASHKESGSSDKAGTSTQGNQSSNHRDNVTQFSDIKDKQNRQHNEKQNDQFNNQQDAESQHRNQSESQQRYTQNQTDDTTEKTTNQTDNQQKQDTTDRSETRSVETSNTKQQTTSQARQTNQVDSKHRETNNAEPKVQPFQDKSDNPSQTSTNTTNSTSRNAENHQFKKAENQPKSRNTTQSDSTHREPKHYNRGNERNQLNRVNNNNRQMWLNRQTDKQPSHHQYQRDTRNRTTNTKRTQQTDTEVESKTSSRRETHSKNESRKGG